MLLAVNAGSSSLKVALFDGDARERLFDATVQEIGGAAALRIAGENHPVAAPDHVAAVDAVLTALAAAGFGLDALQGAGHRMVHGGERFQAPTPIDPEALAEIDALGPLAPLHNPPAVATIRAIAERRGDLFQAAFFDTAFHAQQPDVARRYALPKAQQEAGLRRYGFHGLSYQGLVESLSTNQPGGAPERLLALHLGNGASVCAIRNGVSVATSMGYSPLEGLTMGTRVGSIDAALVLRLARELGVDETERLLTRESGLKGLSGGLSDMRLLESAGTDEAAFAIEHFCYWAARHAGSMIAAMEGVDLIAFTGGIGENAAAVRGRIVELLSWTGAPTVVSPADEERVVATGLRKLLG